MTTEHVAARINAWEVAQRQFDIAAERLHLNPGMRSCCACRTRVDRELPGPDGRRHRRRSSPATASSTT